jgi:hypothetical protein
MSELFSSMSKELTKAMVAFQQAVDPPIKQSDGYQYKYANFATIRQAVMPALSAAGLTISQPIRIRKDANGQAFNTIVTRLSHVSGEYIQSEIVPAQQDASGKQNPHHLAGAGITYAKRTAYLSILGLAPEDTDADSVNPAPSSYYRKYKKLYKEAVSLGIPVETLPVVYRSSSKDDIIKAGKELNTLITQPIKTTQKGD